MQDSPILQTEYLSPLVHYYYPTFCNPLRRRATDQKAQHPQGSASAGWNSHFAAGVSL
jgi:hypothetical protein